MALPGVSIEQLNNLNGFGDLVNIIVRLAYRIAMLFMLYKLIMIGYKYMTNQGDANVSKALSTGLKNLIIGSLILFGSYIILYTINPQLTQFPRALYCDPSIAKCEQATDSKSGTHVYVPCIATDKSGDGSDRSSMFDVDEFEKGNKNYLANHGD